MVESSLLVVGAVVVGTLVTVARVGHPSPKRRHLYETEEGERANPFRDLSMGAEAAAESCGDCGAALESESFRYCGSCDPGPVADD
ncbi:hypothetical protein BRC70_08620 [Halobacteriales archaeon QH_6_68_27]|jgi:hypothetical protein|nr:MAG: hypothetical protein BRC70_08620 [Halobacteriales archaeon QH_6_68_27]